MSGWKYTGIEAPADPASWRVSWISATKGCKGVTREEEIFSSLETTFPMFSSAQSDR